MNIENEKPNVSEERIVVNDLIAALCKAQLEIQAPEKDKMNPRFKTKYASLDAIYSACRLPLAKHGLSISHTVSDKVLITTLHHISGQTLINHIPLFIDQNTSQGFASGLTYARRYAVCSLLGLPTDEDDDGELATQEQAKVATLNEAQVDAITQLINDDKELYRKMLAGYRLNSLYEIPASEFNVIMKRLRTVKGVV